MPTNTKRVTISMVLLVVITAVSMYALQEYIAHINKSALTRVDVAITKQQIILATLSESARSNGADTITNRFIVDCNAVERQRFDFLLDTLSKNILSNELTELNSLFFTCGSFYADRRAVMAIKLSQAVEYFAELIDIESSLTATSEHRTKILKAWKELSESELKTAEYFKKLVSLQGKIITDLRSGKSSDSPEISATLTEVQSVRGQMLVLSKQIEVNKQETQ